VAAASGAAAVGGMTALDWHAPIDAMQIARLRVLPSLRPWLHTAATVSMGVGMMVAVDMVLLPWLDVHAAVRGAGEWAQVPVPVRAAAVAGWCVLSAAVLLSVTQGVVAL